MGRDVPLSGVLPYRAAQGLRYGYNFYNMKVKEDYDVMNAHISPSEWIRHNNPRVMWYCHTPPREVYDLYETRMKHRSYKQKFLYSAMTNMYKIIAGRVVKRIEVVAANSTNTQKRIQQYFDRASTVINPGIDAAEYSNSGDDRYFLYPSRILVNKRQDYVVEAFKRFAASDKKHRYSLVLAGTLSRDPEHSAYYEKVKKMAGGLNVKIETNVTEAGMKKLYANSTAVLFAAENEDYGLVPLEGMASGKPVISVDEGGPRETVVDSETGFLVDSPEQMAERMVKIVQDGALAERLGKNGRKRVEQQYSWNVFFKKFDRLLEETRKKRAD